MFATETITESSISSLASSIKSFLNRVKPSQHSVSIFYDSVSNSSSKYTAIISYQQN